jgi:hypothetical protein
VFPFCDITKIKNLLPPELELLESRAFAEDLAQISSDAKLGEAWSALKKAFSSVKISGS